MCRKHLLEKLSLNRRQQWQQSPGRKRQKVDVGNWEENAAGWMNVFWHLACLLEQAEFCGARWRDACWCLLKLPRVWQKPWNSGAAWHLTCPLAWGKCLWGSASQGGCGGDAKLLLGSGNVCGVWHRSEKACGSYLSWELCAGLFPPLPSQSFPFPSCV